MLDQAVWEKIIMVQDRWFFAGLIESKHLDLCTGRCYSTLGKTHVYCEQHVGTYLPGLDSVSQRMS